MFKYSSIIKEKPMNKMSKRLLFWTPRVVCILFAVFLSLFSLDVFSEDYSIRETILALLTHLVPVYIVVIALALAWRWEWIGAFLFIALALFYLFMTRFRAPWSTYLIISGPSFLVGVLFLLNRVYREELRTR
jgi:hypothetical protein